MPRNRLVDLIVLAFFVALCLAICALGAAVVATSVDTWYADLAKPSKAVAPFTYRAVSSGLFNNIVSSVMAPDASSPLVCSTSQRAEK